MILRFSFIIFNVLFYDEYYLLNHVYDVERGYDDLQNDDAQYHHDGIYCDDVCKGNHGDDICYQNDGNALKSAFLLKGMNLGRKTYSPLPNPF